MLQIWGAQKACWGGGGPVLHRATASFSFSCSTRTWTRTRVSFKGQQTKQGSDPQHKGKSIGKFGTKTRRRYPWLRQPEAGVQQVTQQQIQYNCWNWLCAYNLSFIPLLFPLSNPVRRGRRLPSRHHTSSLAVLPFLFLICSSFPAGSVGNTKVCCFAVQVRGYTEIPFVFAGVMIPGRNCKNRGKMINSSTGEQVHASLKMSEYFPKPEISWRPTSGPRSRRRDFQNRTLFHVIQRYKPFCPFLPFLC